MSQPLRRGGENTGRMGVRNGEMSSLPVQDDSGKEARNSGGSRSHSPFSSSSHPSSNPHQSPVTRRRSPDSARDAETVQTTDPQARSLRMEVFHCRGGSRQSCDPELRPVSQGQYTLRSCIFADCFNINCYD